MKKVPVLEQHNFLPGQTITNPVIYKHQPIMYSLKIINNDSINVQTAALKCNYNNWL